MSKKERLAEVKAPMQRLGFLLYRVGVQVAQTYGERIRPLGFSPVEVGLMTHLASGGEDHVRAIARTLGVSPQTIVNVSNRLEGRGFLTRRKSETDQRVIRVKMTDKGFASLVKVDEAVTLLDRDITRRMGEENVQEITRSLERFLHADP